VDALARAKRVRLLVLDVDGVLTDGGLYYDARGEIIKRFNVQDGLGIKTAQAAGIEVAVITGLSSEAVHARVRELGIREYHDGFKEKLPVIERMARENGLEMFELAYMGDDWVDAGPMSRVGLAMAVADAQPEVLAMAHWVSSRPGGHGAVREAITYLLGAQDKLEPAFRKWLP
jgi:3-deoxy-D-manno-octulosonate 8-phosphate phosphatase (KDO 8-P phosphatase)